MAEHPRSARCRRPGRAIGAALAVLLAAPLPATAEPAPAARQEIAHLFGYLERSGCRFGRNGAWHSAAEARSHLDRKYQYLSGRGLADTAESFIEGAATRSSLSGAPYQVQCANGPLQDSGTWFREELARYRRPGRG